MKIERKVGKHCIHDYKYKNCLYKSSSEQFTVERKLYRGITQRKCRLITRNPRVSHPRHQKEEKECHA